MHPSSVPGEEPFDREVGVRSRVLRDRRESVRRALDALASHEGERERRAYAEAIRREFEAASELANAEADRLRARRLRLG